MKDEGNGRGEKVKRGITMMEEGMMAGSEVGYNNEI